MLYFTSIASLKLKTKSDILVPCLTDVGCVTPIIILGFKPIPVDICKKNFNVSLDEIKKKITKNTSAVIVAHIGGEVTDIDKISKYLKSKKIKLIEDCSQSHGAMYKKIRWVLLEIFLFFQQCHLSFIQLEVQGE